MKKAICGLAVLMFGVMLMWVRAADERASPPKKAEDTEPPPSVAQSVTAAKKLTNDAAKSRVDVTSAKETTRSKAEDKHTTLPEVLVTDKADKALFPGEAIVPAKEKYQLPQTTQSITSRHIDEAINAVSTEDVVKYFPSLSVRKRNNGDTQSPLATRSWGLNSGARTLIYADNILLSALIGNNNTAGSPHWNMISPEAIERVDFLYGPFAAAYPGNSMGGVLLITTKMPDKLLLEVNQTETVQDFKLYGTKDAYRTDQTSISIGNKNGDVAWLLTGSYLNSYSQPIAFVTSATTPTGTSGTSIAQNKLGAAANVVGAGGLLHNQMENFTGKVAWDVTSTLKVTYQIGLWCNDTDSEVQTYLVDARGSPTFGSVSGFANNNYRLSQKHLANDVGIKTDTQGLFDWEASLSNYYYLEDTQRSPYGVLANSAAFTTNGNIARQDGTNWEIGELKGICRPDGVDGANEISFGFHVDRYNFDNPTYGTSTWNSGDDSSTSIYTVGRGTTMTYALWAQDAWRFAKDFKLTLGGRLEYWEAFDGYNLSTRQAAAGGIIGTTSQNQPGLDSTKFSPKISLNWTPSEEWEVTTSFGQAYRFPTVTELYQIVSTGTTFTVPNAGLKPESVLAEELAVIRKFSDGQIRFSVFNEDVSDALISQTGYLTTTQTPFTFVTNVNEIRNTGLELAVQKDNVLCHGLTLFGNTTWVTSEILSDPTFVGATGNTTAEGKFAPNIPEWRGTFGATYHPTDYWALTAAGRYSGMMYTTLDNTDVNPNVYGGFSSYLVLDVRAQYKINDRIFIAAGVDNVTEDKYFLFHPFPQRTYTAQVKVQF